MGLWIIQIYLYKSKFRFLKNKVFDSFLNFIENFCKKCKPNAFEANGVMGVVVHPVIVKITN